MKGIHIYVKFIAVLSSTTKTIVNNEIYIIGEMAIRGDGYLVR